MCIRDRVKGERFAEKAIYSITDAGRAYCETLMDTIAEQNVPLTFDFNVVITNLNKMDQMCIRDSPLSACTTVLIYWAVSNGVSMDFIVPWSSVLFCVNRNKPWLRQW